MDNSPSNKNVPDPRNWQGSGNRSVANMFIDLGNRVSLTDEQFQEEMAKRRDEAEAHGKRRRPRLPAVQRGRAAGGAAPTQNQQQQQSVRLDPGASNAPRDSSTDDMIIDQQRCARCCGAARARSPCLRCAGAQSLSYTSGQNISPAYEGWEEDADGTSTSSSAT